MSYTPVFVELFVVGAGASVWLTLFALVAFSSTFHGLALPSDGLALALFTVASYVVGIVIDRVSRGLFECTAGALMRNAELTERMLDRVRSYVPDATASDIFDRLESFIRQNAPRLIEKIDYDRSRFRICRSWTIHFILIAVALPIWGLLAKPTHPIAIAPVLVADLVFLVLTVVVTLQLARDYERALWQSFDIVEREMEGRLERNASFDPVLTSDLREEH